MKTLTDNFINELFKLCLRKKQIFEITQEHLKFNYLPSEQYKEVWQAMTQYVATTDKLLTIGLLTQQFEASPKIIQVINDIKTSDTPSDQEVLEQLELFIKNKIFIEAYSDLHDKFNRGDKEGAFLLMGEVSEQLKTFQINEKSGGSTIFSQYLKRYEGRLEVINAVNNGSNQKVIKRKVPTGIVPIDSLLKGGIDKGDTFLILADSGVGKSKMMKTIGLSAARRGYNVVHIQAEGTKKEAEEAYDAAIAGKNINDIEVANLSQKDLKLIGEAVDQWNHEGGEIHIKAFEQFDTGTMREIHAFCETIVDQYGPIDMLILDYLDEVDPGDGQRYPATQDGTRLKRRASAKKFKNVCVEFDCAGVTATQANDISDKLKEDPSFVLKRGNTSENRKLLQPFSYLFTLNRTSEEEKNNTMRLYADKLRKYGSDERTLHIVTNFNVERFYDHKNTVLRFGEYE
jgi:hypothetical protein